MPSDPQRAVVRTCQRALEALVRDGGSSAVANEPTPFAEREEIVRTKDHLALRT